MASTEDAPSHLPGITAELAAASAALARAVALGLDFRPAMAREAEERQRAEASIAALQARLAESQAIIDAEVAAKEAVLARLGAAEAARDAEAAAKEAALEQIATSIAALGAETAAKDAALARLAAAEAARDDAAASLARLPSASSEIHELHVRGIDWKRGGRRGSCLHIRTSFNCVAGEARGPAPSPRAKGCGVRGGRER